MEQLRGLEITTTIGCRVNCRYCPQSLLLSRYYETDKNRKKFLDFEDYTLLYNFINDAPVS